ncbi:MAG: SUF system Fe-S cluster assembly regulator [Sandaracinaceae bacterium]|nr:SUF system Fe-S cluster assembly regulator [Sandaracinaceae bacterium]
MLRISKLTDYAVVLATALSETESPRSVAQLALGTGIPAPTVSKVLKTLTREGIVVSQRGKFGGYRLARPADAISIAELIVAIEGPISVTECAESADGAACALHDDCGVRANWKKINRAVEAALEEISISDMSGPEEKLVPLLRSFRAAEENRKVVNADLTDALTEEVERYG